MCIHVRLKPKWLRTRHKLKITSYETQAARCANYCFLPATYSLPANCDPQDPQLATYNLLQLASTTCYSRLTPHDSLHTPCCNLWS